MIVIRGVDKIIETARTVLTFLSLFWKNLEAHCFHYFPTDSPTKQLENSENTELLDSPKTVREKSESSSFLCWSQSFYHIIATLLISFSN